MDRGMTVLPTICASAESAIADDSTAVQEGPNAVAHGPSIHCPANPGRTMSVFSACADLRLRVPVDCNARGPEFRNFSPDNCLVANLLPMVWL